MMIDNLLEIENLTVEFPGKRGVVRAVGGIDLAVRQGESLGLVGESGCGKSTLGLSILRLIQQSGHITSGAIKFRGKDLLAMSVEEIRRIRGREISMIFQDPSATLNPVVRVGDQIAELFRYHGGAERREIRKNVIDMLNAVGIPQPEQRYHAYPHELSGGMQQRVIIAGALILSPQLVIADEPTTALDVTVQAQILELLQSLIDGDANSSVILISHDLGVIAQMCDRVCVMYAGEIVEIAPTDEILDHPRHPYTVGLIASIPRIDVDDEVLEAIPGTIADMIDPPSGCKFHPRCSQAMERCKIEEPRLYPQTEGVSVACHLFDGLR